MNERQLAEFGRMQFFLLDLVTDVDLAVSPKLIEAMESIRAIVETLPAPGSLGREQQWKLVKPYVMQALEPYTQVFGNELIRVLTESAPEMQNHSKVMAERAGLSDVRLVAPEAVLTEKMVNKIVIGKDRLPRLLGVGRATSPLTIQNAKKVDQLVTRGILEDRPTRDIAEDIVQIVNRAGDTYINTRGYTVTRNIKATSKTIARTAIQSTNNQITEATWEANMEAINEAGFVYEYVATLDSRTSEQCAFLDGETWEKLADAPKPPLHPNCRSQLVLNDPDDPFFNEAQRTGQQLYEEKQPDGYATKVKVKGEKFFRKAKDVQGGTRYVDYIADSNRLTQREFFGGGPAGGVGDQRADFFRREVSGGKDPRQVLREMTSGTGGNRRFLPAANLPR